MFLRSFKLLAFLEGLSFLVLLGVAMPLKYIWDKPEAVKIVGMAHGILFILYNIWVLMIRDQVKWNIKQTLIAMVASVLPFGTFIVVAKMFPKTTDA